VCDKSFSSTCSFAKTHAYSTLVAQHL
jgi:hypothetical protein